MNIVKITTQTLSRIALLLLLVASFSLLTSLPAHAATKGEQLIDLCAKRLKVGKKDAKVAACAYGYNLAIQGKKNASDCDSQFKGNNKSIQACKSTGYPLGKDDPLKIGNQGNGNGNQGNGNGNGIGPPAELSGISSGGLPDVSGNSQTIKTILQIIFGIIGAFAVLNITLSGLKYVTSAGNEQKTSEAKNGIVYSLVGLVIAISAEAIVAFVVNGAST